jgi:predicted nucleic acid-binding Zn ribbon protein
MRRDKLRALVLSEWRGLPATPRPSAESVRPIAGTLKTVLAALGLSERIKEEEVLHAWREIVGDFIAAQSSPFRLKDGVLIVRVLQPTVHYELDRIWKPQILARLRQRFGNSAVREIKFRVG